jgi:transcriptional regulator with XRE-family HTH domain
MDIGKRFSEIRVAKGLSQGDIEKRSGLLRCYISRVEHGHTVPGFETLERMAKALEIETYQLIFEGDKEPQAISIESIAAPETREYKLISDFRKLNRRDQELIIALMGKLGKLS